MKTAFLELFTSKKFLAALSAVLIYLAGRFGFALDPAALDHIFTALLVYVGAQGAADIGKSAALIRAAAPANDNATPLAAMPSSRSNAAAMLAVLLLALGGAAALPACSSWQEVKADVVAVQKGAVTCAKADVSAIKALGLTLTVEALVSVMSGHGLPLAQLELEAEAGAKTQGIAVGSCAFGQLIADIGKILPAPTAATSTVMARRDDGSAELELLKAHLGITTINLDSGQAL